MTTSQQGQRQQAVSITKCSLKEALVTQRVIFYRAQGFSAEFALGNLFPIPPQHK